MRIYLSTALLLLFLSTALPAEAQWRDAAIEQKAPAKMYASTGSGFSLNNLFDPSVFRMSQSLEFSSSSFGGNTSSLGMFTNSMQRQFNDKLAARVDVSAAYSPNMGSFSDPSGNMNGNAQIFVRNAQIAYRPTENMHLQLTFRQNPYGGLYASPYGFYGREYGFIRFNASVSSDDLFWRNSGR